VQADKVYHLASQALRYFMPAAVQVATQLQVVVEVGKAVVVPVAELVAVLDQLDQPVQPIPAVVVAVPVAKVPLVSAVVQVDLA
jgi:hypothetical protein